MASEPVVQLWHCDVDSLGRVVVTGQIKVLPWNAAFTGSPSIQIDAAQYDVIHQALVPAKNVLFVFVVDARVALYSRQVGGDVAPIESFWEDLKLP